MICRHFSGGTEDKRGKPKEDSVLCTEISVVDFALLNYFVNTHNNVFYFTMCTSFVMLLGE